jgi:hypothetical protein
MRNSTGWTTGARKSAGASGLRRGGINLIMLGAFALVAAGVVLCLAGWRMVVVARHREHSSDQTPD